MTASDARSMAIEASGVKEYSDALLLIKESASKGKFYTLIPKLSEKVKSYLFKQGYAISWDTDKDGFDSVNWS